MNCVGAEVHKAWLTDARFFASPPVQENTMGSATRNTANPAWGAGTSSGLQRFGPRG